MLSLAACADEEGTDLEQELQEGQILVPETEPNTLIADATPIVGSAAVLSGDIFSPPVPPAIAVPDVDFYSFTAAAGDRVYVATGASNGVSGGDTAIRLHQADGTEIEFDDDDGFFPDFSSSIAGRVLPTAGTYVISVRGFGATTTVRGYQLHFQLRSGAPVAEAEPNDTQLLPQPLPAGGWVSGDLTTAADQDWYQITVNAGDTIFASLDQDPERDTTDMTGATLAIGLFSPTNVFIGATSANDTGVGPTAGFDSRANFVTVKNAGTYVVGVFGTLAGNYQLNVTVHPPDNAGCLTYTTATPPFAVPDLGNITDSITVPDDFIVGNVEVALNFTGTRQPDMDINLTAPGGTLSGVLEDSGSSTIGPFAVDGVVDDDAAFRANFFTIFNGFRGQPNTRYRLRHFDGMRSQGTWTLRAFDDLSTQVQTINSWAITLCPARVAATPTCAPDQVPVTVFSTDFETDDSGFTHGGTLDQWQRGLPASPPIDTCNGGSSNCFKTNLAGDYANSSIQNLTSPGVNLTGVLPPIRLSWAQKYQLESASFDHLTIGVQEVGGARPRQLYQFADGDMEVASMGSPAVPLVESAGWGLAVYDISAYANATIETIFHIDTDPSVQRAGVGIDDYSVIGCEVACGNGDVNAPETCDPGQDINGDVVDTALCDFNCTLPVCGDGYFNPVAEACDGGPLCDPVTCTLLTCGNGAADPGEDCDPGAPGVNTATCDSNCTFASCGDNFTNPNTTIPEECDVGGVDTTLCNAATCQLSECGDSYENAADGETCDEGTAADTATCNAGCTLLDCGDAYVNTVAEDCESGGVDTAACNGNTTTGDCTFTDCGDGYTNGAVETCDVGSDLPAADTAACNAGTCQLSDCGDDYLNTVAGEGCDVGSDDPDDDTAACNAGTCELSVCSDGYTNIADAEQCDTAGNSATCDANCTFAVCGDTTINPAANESCDDGNVSNNDTCLNTCRAARCGDTFVQTGIEMCDTGGVSATCDADCTSAVCGDNVTNPVAGEDCDTGAANTADCDANCTEATCGDGTFNSSADEQCDDGNDTNLDDCRNTCTLNECGDGLIGSDEECDDGNATSGDNCNASCERDTDGDTIADVEETFDPNGETSGPPDTDGDDTADYEDDDSDADNISDADEAGDADLDTAAPDTDADSVPNYQDSDSDEDGVTDLDEAGDDDLDTAPVDSDDDGTPDYLDTDSDDDGVEDGDDNCRIVENEDQQDTNGGVDGDGVGDVCTDDTDGDGFDFDDNCPEVANPDQVDVDEDGIGDICDDSYPEPAGCYDCSSGGSPGNALALIGFIVLGLRRRKPKQA